MKKNRTIPKKNPKHAKTHQHLYSEFSKMRKMGRKISFLWIFITGRKLAIKHSQPQFTKWATQRFLVKYNIKMRKVQRKKQKPKSIHAESLKQWMHKFRYIIIYFNKSVKSDLKKKSGMI